jgi:hypothetical protein
MVRKLFAICAVAALLAFPSVQSSRAATTSIVWDDFQNGFTVNAADAKWFYFSAPPYVGDDGIVTTSSAGLRVISSGVNPTTGKPAFVRTLGQEVANGGLPGGLDHVKWLAYMNHQSSSGYPGFDAPTTGELVCESWISGRSYGVGEHPFRDAVRNPNDDLRLGSVAMNSIDFDTFMVFDFFLTNKGIYAFYERLPFARGTYGNYAAFSFQIPIAARRPGDIHHLKLAYDKSAGTVRWLINNKEVYRVSNIGYRIDRKFMTIDHGGVEGPVSPNQLNCGMGMFTLLDGHKPSDQALVRLSDADNFYFNPRLGEPSPQTFVDNASLDSSRLFGQGAELRMVKYQVSY